MAVQGQGGDVSKKKSNEGKEEGQVGEQQDHRQQPNPDEVRASTSSSGKRGAGVSEEDAPLKKKKPVKVTSKKKPPNKSTSAKKKSASPNKSPVPAASTCGLWRMSYKVILNLIFCLDEYLLSSGSWR